MIGKIILLITAWISVVNVSSARQGDALNFNPKQIERELSAIDRPLRERDKNTQLLLRRIERWESLYAKADDCIEESKEKIGRIEKIVKAHLPDNPQIATHLSFLTQTKKKLQKKLAYCQISAFRLDEAIVAYKGELYQLTTHNLFKRDASLWALMGQDWHEYSKFLNMRQIKQHLGLDRLNIQVSLSFILILLGATLIGYGVSRRFSPTYQGKHPFYRAVLNTWSFSGLTLFLLLLSAALIHWYFYTLRLEFSVGLAAISELALLCGLLVTLAFFLFMNGRKKYNPLRLPSRTRHLLFKRVSLIIVFLFLGQSLMIVAGGVNTEFESIDLFKSLYYCILSGLMIWCFWPLIRFYRTVGARFFYALSLMVTFWFACSIILEALGYHNVNWYVSSSLMLTLLLVLVSLPLVRILRDYLSDFSSKKTPFSLKLHRALGVKIHRKLNELALIRMVIYGALGFVLIVSLLHIWKAPVIIIDTLEKIALEGIEFSGLTVAPFRWVVAALVFVTINLSGRYIVTKINGSRRSEGGGESQVAIASLISYVIFSVALIVSLVVAGINFTGLAIIVGALSVGVGLGLQNIVNNFISGIILLLEKPIKPGDRIIVGGVEGYVRRIRVRSTQIQTQAREDVIMPNADLVTNPVTNLMFRGTDWRVTCRVGVAYDSDIKAVTAALFEVGRSHPLVVKSNKSPRVMFTEFSDSCLKFELWCIIRDVNLKNEVHSQLNYAIEQSFREHGIVIAFPQMDIHLKKE